MPGDDRAGRPGVAAASVRPRTARLAARAAICGAAARPGRASPRQRSANIGTGMGRSQRANLARHAWNDGRLSSVLQLAGTASPEGDPGSRPRATRALRPSSIARRPDDPAFRQRIRPTAAARLGTRRRHDRPLRARHRHPTRRRTGRIVSPRGTRSSPASTPTPGGTGGPRASPSSMPRSPQLVAPGRDDRRLLLTLEESFAHPTARRPHSAKHPVAEPRRKHAARPGHPPRPCSKKRRASSCAQRAMSNR